MTIWGVPGLEPAEPSHPIIRPPLVVIMLQTLFRDLTHSNLSAVTPETELAYLALVPGKEEDFGGTELTRGDSTSNPRAPDDADDDLIIIDPLEKESAVQTKSPSILGKRTTDEKEDEVPMLVSSVHDSYAPSSSLPIYDSPSDPLSHIPPSPADVEMAEASPLPNLSRSSSMIVDSDERDPKRGRSVDHYTSSSQPMVDASSNDAERMRGLSQPQSQPEASPVEAFAPPAPPLPPRPQARPVLPERKQTKNEKLEAEVSSYMAFGRQNDVTECMDNVMFQIEAALKANVANTPGDQESLPKR